MSQETDYLLMMSDADIDYNNLAEDTLKQLALEIEPYIANSALTELWLRKGSQVVETAWDILLRSNDESLQMTALKIIFDMDRERALDYMVEQAQTTNLSLLNTMLETILYETDFRFEMQVAGIIKARLKNLEDKENILDLDVVEDFKRVLNFVENS